MYLKISVISLISCDKTTTIALDPASELLFFWCRRQWQQQRHRHRHYDGETLALIILSVLISCNKTTNIALDPASALLFFWSRREWQQQRRQQSTCTGCCSIVVVRVSIGHPCCHYFTNVIILRFNVVAILDISSALIWIAYSIAL